MLRVPLENQTMVPNRIRTENSFTLNLIPTQRRQVMSRIVDLSSGGVSFYNLYHHHKIEFKLVFDTHMYQTKFSISTYSIKPRERLICCCLINPDSDLVIAISYTITTILLYS